MSKVILGFVAGMAFTSLAFVMFDASSPPSLKQIGDFRNIIPPASEEGQRDPQSSQTPSIADNAQISRLSESDASDAGLPEDLTRFALRDGGYLGAELRELLSDWTDVELRALEDRSRSIAERSQEMLEAERVMNMVGVELQRREQIASWANEPPPNRPINLPPEFDSLLESFGVRNKHELLQRESSDPDWSPLMETSLWDFFASNPQISTAFSLTSITCRTSACELSFVAYNTDAASRAAERGTSIVLPGQIVGSDFRQATSQIFEQPWAGQFQLDTSRPSISLQGDVATIIWQLNRAEDWEQ
jgi:hypothetical protein